MEFKLFGKSLFELKTSRKDFLLNQVEGSRKESKYLPDFYQGRGNFHDISNYVIMTEPEVFGSTNSTTTATTSGSMRAVAVPIKKDEQKIKVELTPKGIYQARLLHDQAFKLNTNPEYVDSQLSDFKDKLSLIKSEEYDMANGVKEIASIVTRLENRKKYPEVHEFFNEFPYTTTAKIEGLTKAHNYLKLGQVAQFLADMPKEAVKVMKDYNKYTDKVCGKQAVFYILANKKDFEKSQSRRDPILFAQSPFGHFWQILGAWDEEMMLLEAL